jgi:hypothetical protein
VEDVNPEGTIVKKTLVSNDDEYRQPNEGALVTLRLIGEGRMGSGFSSVQCRLGEPGGEECAVAEADDGLVCACVRVCTGQLPDGTVFVRHEEGHELVFTTDEDKAGPLWTVDCGLWTVWACTHFSAARRQRLLSAYACCQPPPDPAATLPSVIFRWWRAWRRR